MKFKVGDRVKGKKEYRCEHWIGVIKEIDNGLYSI